MERESQGLLEEVCARELGRRGFRDVTDPPGNPEYHLTLQSLSFLIYRRKGLVAGCEIQMGRLEETPRMSDT